MTVIPLPSTLREGVLGGLVFGAVFSAGAVVILAFRWPDVVGGFWLSVLRAGGTYMVGGTLGGGLLFWLRPILRRRFGRAIVGSIVFLPVTLLIALQAHGSDDLSLFEGMVIGVFIAMLFGSVIGQTLLRDQ